VPSIRYFFRSSVSRPANGRNPEDGASSLVPLFINTMTYDNIDFQFNFLGFVQTEKLQSCRDTAHTSSSYPKKNAPNWNSEHENIRHRIEMSFALKSFSLPPKAFPTTSSPRVWIRHARSSVSGDNASIVNVYQGWTNNRGAAGRPFFPPASPLRLKHWLANFRVNATFLCRGCPFPTFAER